MYVRLGCLGQSTDDDGDDGLTQTVETQVVNGQIEYINPVTGEIIESVAAPGETSAPVASTLVPTSPASAQTPTPGVTIPSGTSAASAGSSVNPIVLPNGVAINPAALTAAQKALTPAQLQAQLYPGTAPGSTFNLSTWLTQSTIISGISNQAITLGGIFFGGLMAIILGKKKR
jgi:hypothetical protein